MPAPLCREVLLEDIGKRFLLYHLPAEQHPQSYGMLFVYLFSLVPKTAVAQFHDCRILSERHYDFH